MSQILTEQQIEAAYLLATGKTAESIAKQLGINRITITRWKKLPEFQSEMRNILQDMRDGIAERLIRLADRSLDLLEYDLTNGGIDGCTNRALKVIDMLGTQNFKLPAPADAPPEKQTPAKEPGLA